MTAETEMGQHGYLIEEPLEVSYSKLSDGIKTVFLGVYRMLESIKPSQARALVEPIISGLDTFATNATRAPASALELDKTAGEAAVDEPTETGQQEVSATPTVIVDDITKVIVAKIHQKRSNNAVIGQILKAYGAERITDLDPAKYEAFLTDISGI